MSTSSGVNQLPSTLNINGRECDVLFHSIEASKYPGPGSNVRVMSHFIYPDNSVLGGRQGKQALSYHDSVEEAEQVYGPIESRTHHHDYNSDPGPIDPNPELTAAAGERWDDDY